MTVLGLDVNPANTANVNFMAGQTSTIRVQGVVAPTTSGGTVSLGAGGTSPWTPNSILVSGGLGTATRVSATSFTGVRAFDTVNLNAGQDILLGSARFISLIQGTGAGAINIGQDRPSGAPATGDEIGRQFLVAGRLNASSSGKLVQQNTSGSRFEYSGVYLANSRTGARGVVLTIDPPQVVDLFGSFVDANGVVQSGSTAARSLASASTIVTTQGAQPYRFNGCTISVSAVCGGGALNVAVTEQGVQPDVLAVLTAGSSQFDPRIDGVLLPVAPSESADVQTDLVVTGAGNEEIWRTRGKDGQ